MILATFSLDWFMTIPGMLITGGVLFLIIALVIFIATGNKKPKTKKEVVEAQDASKQEAAVAATADTNQNIPNSQMVTPQPVVNSEPVTPVSSARIDSAPQEIEPAVFTAPIPQNITPQPTFNNESYEKVQTPTKVVNPTTPVVNTVATPSVVTPKEEVVAPVVPTIEPQPVINQPIVSEVPVKEEKKETIPTPVVDMPRPIYGGVSPIVPNVSHEEEHRPIYGGANPLENTQSVPIVPQRPIVTEEVKAPTVDIPKVPVTPTVASEVSNDIFANSSFATPSFTSQQEKVEVAPQPQTTVSQNQTEEIESLF